jgi:hypothetical protein
MYRSTSGATHPPLPQSDSSPRVLGRYHMHLVDVCSLQGLGFRVWALQRPQELRAQLPAGVVMEVAPPAPAVWGSGSGSGSESGLLQRPAVPRFWQGLLFCMGPLGERNPEQLHPLQCTLT